MQVLGIITPDGLALYARAGLKTIRDYSSLFLGTTLVAADHQFFGYVRDTDNVPATDGTTSITTAYPAREIDTNIELKNRSPNAQCVYTKFAIEWDNAAPGAAEGTVPSVPIVLLDLIIISMSAWFQCLLGGADKIYDEGALLDFPSGKGFTGISDLTTALTTQQVFSNGNVGLDQMRLLPMPCDIGKETFIGARMRQQHTTLNVAAAAIRLRANYYGQKQVVG